MTVQGALWLTKRLSLNLNFSFINRIRYFSYQVATQLSSRGWVDLVPDPILPEKFLGYSRESNPGPLGWKSDVLTTIPNLSWNAYLKLLYKSWNWYRTKLNVLLQNLMHMEHSGISFSLFLLLTVYLPSPNLGLTPQGLTPNARGSDASRGSNCLWTGTLDRYTRAGIPECVVNTMSGSPPETAQDRTQTKDTTQSQDRN